jgi:hypothetical protein
MNPDSAPLGAGRNGLGGHIMVRRHITPHNSVRHIAAAASTDADIAERVSGRRS